jgi:hypothetical protein
LLWTSFEFTQAAHGEERNADSTRAFAAQLIAVRVLRTMSSQDVIRALTLDFDLPSSETSEELPSEGPAHAGPEGVGLLSGPTALESDPEAGTVTSRQNGSHAMSVLEIWKGNVVLWGDLDINASIARKKPTVYSWRRTMWVGYARLRVPRYRFAFQVANFSVLLVLFLATLMQPDRDHISVQEIFLDVWFLGFAYAELGTTAQ